MDITPSRRAAMALLGLSMSAGAAEAASAVGPADLLPSGAPELRALTERLARAPRRRDFRTVPMFLEDPMLWDHEVLAELLAYRSGPKQIWNNTDLAGGWLNGMRNALNVQILSLKHPDFLVVSANHGPAELFLLDQAMWDKYQLGKLTHDAYASNTLIMRERAAEASGADNTIPALMDRGVVFMACHMALWEISAGLIKQGANPDRLSHEALAAELTNHLIPGVVLTPGMVAIIPEFQQAGYHYIN